MNNNTFSRWKESLHLKVLLGYLILGLLVLGIITAVWYEKQVFEQAEVEERSLLMQRAAASEAYRGLITLFLDNDRAMLWDDSDMDTYDRRESHTMEVIDIGTDNDSDGTHRTGRGKETERAVRPVPQEKERRTGTHDHTGEHEAQHPAHCGDAAV